MAGLGEDMRILTANAGLAAMVGMPAAELIGRPFEELLTVPARLLWQTHMFPALSADGRVEEVFLTLVNGLEAAVPVLMNAVRSTRSPDHGYSVVIVRIRARSQWENDLLAATRALEGERQASRALSAELAGVALDLEARLAEDRRSRTFRDAFVGVVSHELRTPITTIFGMSHLLRERHVSMDPAAVSASLEDIEGEAERLRRLTEDLLVLSRAEAGRLEVALEPLLIGHLLRTVVTAEGARAEGHSFELTIDPSLPIVSGEETYVEQVLRNFLNNAVKYSPAGSVVRTDARPEDDGVAVRVIDQGVGFGDASPEHLWELFFRTEDARRKASGAGIGLFVSRELITAMGGRVWAKAAGSPSGGAEFGFWLPGIEVDQDA